MEQNTELYERSKNNYSAADHFSDFKYMTEHNTIVVLTITSKSHKMLAIYTWEIKHAVPQIKIQPFQQLIYFL